MSGCVIVTDPAGAFCVRHRCYLDLVDDKCQVERLTERIALAVAFCDEFSGVQVAVTTARILRGG